MQTAKKSASSEITATSTLRSVMRDLEKGGQKQDPQALIEAVAKAGFEITKHDVYVMRGQLKRANEARQQKRRATLSLKKFKVGRKTKSRNHSTLNVDHVRLVADLARKMGGIAVVRTVLDTIEHVRTIQ